MGHYQEVSLYVKNLDDGIDNDRLRKEFKPFGTITSVKVMTDCNGRSRGFGFVSFSSSREARQAVREMNGHIIVSKPLYVAVARRKKQHKTQLASQNMQRTAGTTMERGPMFTMMPQAQCGFYPQMRASQSLPQNPQMMLDAQTAAAMPSALFARAATQPTIAQSENPVMSSASMSACPIIIQQAAATATSGTSVVATVPTGVVTATQPTDKPAKVNQGLPAAYKFTSYMPQPQIVQQPVTQQAVAQQGVPIQDQEPLTVSMQADANEEQKPMLCERLFPVIQILHPDMAERITKMLLEIDDSEMLQLLEHYESLNAKKNPLLLKINECNSYKKLQIIWDNIDEWNAEGALPQPLTPETVGKVNKMFARYLRELNKVKDIQLTVKERKEKNNQIKEKYSLKFARHLHLLSESSDALANSDTVSQSDIRFKPVKTYDKLLNLYQALYTQLESVKADKLCKKLKKMFRNKKKGIKLLIDNNEEQLAKQLILSTSKILLTKYTL